jgi:hypothetical protein
VSGSSYDWQPQALSLLGECHSHHSAKPGSEDPPQMPSNTVSKTHKWTQVCQGGLRHQHALFEGLRDLPCGFSSN